MPPIGKEMEKPAQGFDEIAAIEVDNYVERLEKKAETTTGSSGVQNNQQQSQVKNVVPSIDPVAMLTGGLSSNKKNINLPLDQKGVEDGLKHKINEGVRWLAEWCVMMIKKYPGRVFYLPASPQS